MDGVGRREGRGMMDEKDGKGKEAIKRGWKRNREKEGEAEGNKEVRRGE